MAPTSHERHDLAKRFAADVARMRRCLDVAGRQIDENDIAHAWADYSEGLCAGWLTLPETDDALLAILLKHLPVPGKRWYVPVLDVGDGSGDVILTLPKKLIEQLGWKAGDTLYITQNQSGNMVVERKEHKA